MYLKLTYVIKDDGIIVRSVICSEGSACRSEYSHAPVLQGRLSDGVSF